MAGYRLEALHQEKQRLELDRSALELEEAKLLSPARLEELARMQRFVDPAPENGRVSGRQVLRPDLSEEVTRLLVRMGAMDPLARKRVNVLCRLALVWAALIVLRLVQLQVVQHGEYQRLALRQQERFIEIKAPRGAILDRYGQRLAMSLPVESVCVDPLRVPDLTVAADILSRVLRLDRGELAGQMTDAKAKRRGFLWVKRKITSEEAKRLRDLKLEWIEFRTESQRFYPNKSLAAHVIGGVDFEENGNAGIEQSRNADLEGQARARCWLRKMFRSAASNRKSPASRSPARTCS